MQKYLSVAEHIAARAVGGDAFPKAGVFIEDRVRRIDAGAIPTDIWSMTPITSYG